MNGKRCVTCRKHGRPALCILYDRRTQAVEERNLASIDKMTKGYCNDWEPRRIRKLIK